MLSYSGTNWWSYLDNGGWYFGTDFNINLTGNEGLGWNDEGSIHHLVQNTNVHLFTGKAPDGYQYGKFDNTSFRSYLETGVKTGNPVRLYFYCDYRGAFDNNLYGARWAKA